MLNYGHDVRTIHARPIGPIGLVSPSEGANASVDVFYQLTGVVVLHCRRSRGRCLPHCGQSAGAAEDHTVSWAFSIPSVVWYAPDVRRQVQSPTNAKQYKGVFRSLVRIWKEEGFKGFMRGNGINCVRIIPYSAVQFTSYEQLKKVRLCSFWHPSCYSICAVVHKQWDKGA